MKVVSNTVEIAAPPERVWSVLTDFASYPTWNPFIESLAGVPRVGEKLSVRIHPPGGRAMSFKPTVLVAEENRRLHWLGRLLLPGIFDGEHHLDLTPTANGTSFKQEEKFSGIVVRLMGNTTFEQTQQGFVEMNAALRKRVEG